MSTEAKQAIKWVLISILLLLALVVLVPPDLLINWNKSGRLLEDGAYELGRATGKAMADNCLGILLVAAILGGIFLLARWKPGASA